jgi:F0F1-type ATP synthase epsilon subunit
MADTFLNLKIISPKGAIFNGQILSISSENSAGKFDILSQHANFITFINNKPIIVTDTNRKTFKYNFPLAIIYATNDKVSIYTDIQLQMNLISPEVT